MFYNKLKCSDFMKMEAYLLLDYIGKAIYLSKQMFDVDKTYKQTHPRAIFS